MSLEDAYQTLARSEKILIFTGAGMSTESGIPDFRGPDGLWTRVDPDDFTIQKYHSHPEVRIKSWEMHVSGERWGSRAEVLPNKGHEAIVRLHEAGRLAGVITQNVDGLHHKSGLAEMVVAELHGNSRNTSCLDCGEHWATETVLKRVEAGDPDPNCPECGGLIKTDIVMFGESLPETEVYKANILLTTADAVLVAGSTVSVWPAADFVFRAANMGKPLVIINRGVTDADRLSAVKLDSGIGEALPDLVEMLIS